MKYHLTLIIILASSIILNAQTQDCGTEVSQADMDYLDNLQSTIDDFTYDLANLDVIQIPIANHIVRQSDGTGGLTTGQLATAMQNLNTFYAQTNIEFIECQSVNIINNTNWYNFLTSSDAAIRTANSVPNVLNIYYFNRINTPEGFGVCGYTNVPPGPDRIMMANNCTTSGTTLIHEVGHYLSLYHTHGTSNCGTTDELVNGSNCSTAGDRVCDTPADPNLLLNCSSYVVNSNCVYTGTATDANGQQYSPQTNNIMSYSRSSCRSIFTQQQFDRVVFSALNDRSYLTCANGGDNPDLIISSRSVSSSTIACGSPVTVNATVTNNGTDSTNGISYLGYYLSSNSTLDASDILIASDYVPTLTAGNASAENASLTIPANTAAGNYYILFVADYQSTISESNETNNIVIEAITVTCTQAQPDLIISSRSVNTSTIACGNAVTVNATVTNNGPGSTDGFSYLGYYLSSNSTLDATDILITSDYVPSLAAGNASAENASLRIPAGTAAGNYYILFVADNQSAISESDETNNIVIEAITVTCTQPEPDLIMSSQSVNTTSIACGNSLTASATVLNNGNATTSGSSFLGYYLSTNTTLDASDQLLASDPVNSLNPGVSNFESAPLSIPENTGAGAYYILFVADYQNSISESNENNNVATLAITVSCAAPQPDLIISSRSVSSSTIACGSPVTVNATVTNNGTDSTNGISYLGYYLSSNSTLDASDILIASDYVPTLTASNASAENASLTIPANTAAGNYYILFVADYQSTISESNETNNIVIEAITVTCTQAQPDLIISSRSVNTSTIACGNAVTVNATVTNNGTGSTDGFSYLGYYLSSNSTLDATDILITSDYVPSLAAGNASAENASLTIPAGTAAGNYYILFVADNQSAISESDETNNIVIEAITVTCTQPEPDLIISSQSVNTTSIACGNSLTASATVLNNSNATTSGSSFLGYYLSTNATLDASDQLLASDPVNSLNPGVSNFESAPLSIPENTGAGTYYILFVADYQNAISESNENNNISNQSITVTCATPQSDLIITTQSISSNPVACGSSITGSATVKNNSTNSTNGISHLGYYLSTNTTWDATDELIAIDFVSTLQANGSSNETAPLNIPAGTAAGDYYILFVADHQNVVSESNENNNVAFQSITVTCAAPQSDLVISAQSVSSTTVNCGSALNVTATVKNNGTGSTSGTSYLGYYLSSNTSLDAADILITSDYVQTLSPDATNNESAALNIPEGTAAGNYYILFVADRQNVISESNENNNVASAAITIICAQAMSDLIMSSQSLSATSVACGNSVTAYASVKNNGTGPTNASSYMGYYLSSNTTLESTDLYFTADYVNILGAGNTSTENASLIIPADTPAGNYYILFAADIQSSVIESIENNNVSYVAITVTCNQALPDIIISSQSLGATSIDCGGTLTTTVGIKNNGTVSTNGFSYIRYYLSTNTSYDPTDVRLGGPPYVPNIEAGTTINQAAAFTIPENLAVGNYYILFIADFQDNVTESNENNNLVYEAITITCGNASCPSTVNSFPYYEGFENDLGLWTQDTADDQNWTRRTGRTPSNYTGPIAAAEGSYYMYTEASGNNNEVANLISPCFDLTNMQNPVLTIKYHMYGSHMGSLIVEASTDNGLTWNLLSGTYGERGNAWRTKTHTNLNLYASQTVQIRFRGTIGNGYKSDIAIDAITISDSSNADLMVSEQSISLPSVSCGESLTINGVVTNNGDQGTATSNYLGYYLSSDTSWDANDTSLGNNVVPYSGSGSTTTISETVIIPNNIAPGNYYILLVADAENHVNESDENNNVVYEEVYVSCYCGDDANTLMLLPFDNTLNSTDGESPINSSTDNYSTGIYNQALDLVAATSSSLSYSATGHILSQQGTLEAWVKPRWNGNDAKDHTLLQYGNSGGLLILKNANNNLQFKLNRFSPNAYPEINISTNVEDWLANEWKHIACAWGNGILQLYIDGNLVSSVSISASIYPISDPHFNIGTDNGNHPWEGIIDHLRISDNFRHQTDIQDFMNNCMPTFDPSGECPNSLTELSRHDIIDDESVTHFIITNGLVPTENSVEYKAGQSIELLPEFEVEMGAVLTLTIEACQ